MTKETARGVLFALAVLVFALAFQGSRALSDPDEGRYGQAAREMLDARDPLLPRLHGRPHVTKPPGAYWAAAAGMALFGENPWGARVPVGLAFAVSIGSAALIGARLAGRPGRPRAAAAWSAVALGTSPLAFVGGSLLTADVFLAAVCAALAVCAVLALEDPPRRTAALRAVYVLLGVGFFVKGAPALLPAAGLLFAWPARARAPGAAGEGRLRGLADGPGLAAFAVLAFWWPVWALLAHPDVYRTVVRDELYRRVFTNELSRSGPLWLPVAVFLAGAVPWGLATLAARPALRALLRERPGARFLAGWTLAGLVAFTASRGRMPLYVLPLALPPAVFAGVALSGVLAGRPGLRRVLAAGAALFAAFLLAVRADAQNLRQYRTSAGAAALCLARTAGPGEPVLLLQRTFLPGLAFALGRPLTTVSTDAADGDLPRDLDIADVPRVLAAHPAGVVAIGRPEVFGRLPAGVREVDPAIDPRTGLRVAILRL